MQLRAGEVLHVAGPNGTGKTTLLRVLSGLLHPEQGTVFWGGQPIGREQDEFHASMSYLGHDNALKGDLTATENLHFAVGVRRPVGHDEISATLARLGIARCHDLPARVLSAGQRRRLAMARVLLAQTPLWILDEPFTNLDRAGVHLFSSFIGEHARAGGMVALAAHQSLEIPEMTPRLQELS